MGSEYRAILRDRERELLAEGVDDPRARTQTYYNAKERVRKRLEKLPEELAYIHENYPEADEQLAEILETLQELEEDLEPDPEDEQLSSDEIKRRLDNGEPIPGVDMDELHATVSE